MEPWIVCKPAYSNWNKQFDFLILCSIYRYLFFLISINTIIKHLKICQGEHKYNISKVGVYNLIDTERKRQKECKLI